MTYDDMLDLILQGQMPPEGFSHQHHLGTAHAALRRWEFFEAAYRFASGLRAVTKAAGAPEKYNATVTLAFLSLVAERMEGEDSETFVARNLDLKSAVLADLGYGAARLGDPKARRIGLLPVSV
ncbi:hypothetical protein [Jannaschia sp. CCS1]|uniref:hypothetical protein n=1 Tax=Jannaschia sp. (strain CCS1) TaxID=290400 RepID=UPI000053C803|nr:hypothetical protein [Jannaschia sp. CCS1]ABD52929.1 hypothetical protein Jann_0012 [Jannaschia sp. CCS1]